MKQMLKRTTSFILAICIIAISILLCPITSYAVYDPGTSWWDKFVEETSTYLSYLACRVGAVVNDHDFAKWYQAREDYKDWWNTGHISRLEDSSGNVSYSFDADLVAQIKQALQEYADENNPFKIQKTYAYKTIPASLFPSKQTYNEFVKYCQSHYMVAFMFRSQLSNTNSDMFIGDVSEVVKDGGGFVANGSTVFYTVNANWSKAPVWYDMYNFVKNDDGDMILGTINESVSQCNFFYNYKSTTATFRAGNLSQGYLITKDGGRIRVFNSLAEFQDYNAGQRKVYFGSGFYDFDPTDITATWDEISDAIDRMDGILQDILDAITDNPGMSEEDLEKLIDKLIGKIGEIGDKTDETNSILGDIASSLSGYFSSVLSKLDEILDAIKALVWIEADNKLEGDKSDLFDLIDAIWKNPQEGSQEAADALTGSFSDIAQGLTKKFPFSIPWDIYNLFRVFSGAPSPDEASFRSMTLGVQPFTVDNEDLEQDIHDAPYFKLPLRLDSYGIYEEVVIDLSDFKSVSTLSRGLLAVLFAVFLIKFTMRIIDLFKGGVGD